MNMSSNSSWAQLTFSGFVGWRLIWTHSVWNFKSVLVFTSAELLTDWFKLTPPDIIGPQTEAQRIFFSTYCCSVHHLVFIKFNPLVGCFVTSWFNNCRDMFMMMTVFHQFSLFSVLMLTLNFPFFFYSQHKATSV